MSACHPRGYPAGTPGARCLSSLRTCPTAGDRMTHIKPRTKGFHRGKLVSKSFNRPIGTLSLPLTKKDSQLAFVFEISGQTNRKYFMVRGFDFPFVFDQYYLTKKRICSSRTSYIRFIF